MAYDINRIYSDYDDGVPGEYCRNRKSITPDHGRRTSHYYDDEGDAGGAWYEIGIDDDAYCTFGGCTKTDRRVWEKFAKNFFTKKFTPAKDSLRMAVVSSGLPMSDKVKRVIKNGDDLEVSYRKHKAWVKKEDPGFWSPMDLHEAIEGTINHVDEAACQLDYVIAPMLDELGRSDLAPTGPIRAATRAPNASGQWIGGGPGSGAGPGAPGPKRSPGMVAAGVVLLGAASYFGYKVLTE